MPEQPDPDADAGVEALAAVLFAAHMPEVPWDRVVAEAPYAAEQWRYDARKLLPALTAAGWRKGGCPCWTECDEDDLEHRAYWQGYYDREREVQSRDRYIRDGETPCGEPHPEGGEPCQLRPGHDSHARVASGGFDAWMVEPESVRAAVLDEAAQAIEGNDEITYGFEAARIVRELATTPEDESCG